MFLFDRESFTNCSALVIRGKRMTRKTLEPKLATFSATYLFAPCTMDTTTISVETDRMTPSRVRNERSLCARSVSRAIMAGSLSEMPRRVVFVVSIRIWLIGKCRSSLLRAPYGRRRLWKIVPFFSRFHHFIGLSEGGLV